MKVLQHGLICINSQKKNNIKKFEYLTIYRRNDDLMSLSDLNFEGNDGWELVSLTIAEKAIYIFKREKVK